MQRRLTQSESYRSKLSENMGRALTENRTDRRGMRNRAIVLIQVGYNLMCCKSLRGSTVRLSRIF